MEIQPNRPHRLKFSKQLRGFLGGLASLGEGMSMLTLNPSSRLHAQLSISKPDNELIEDDWRRIDEDMRLAMNDIDNVIKGKQDG
jgi:hypothetical protein